MRKPTVLALTGAILILASATPITAASNVHARNVSYLHELVGHDADLSAPVTFADGRVSTLGEALAEAAQRAGAVDLGALASGQAQPGGPYAGDIWVIASGPGACTVQNVAPQPVGLAPDPQLWIYAGQVGTMSGYGYSVMVIAWTMKLSEFRSNTPYTIAGAHDNYCFNFGGSHFDFPFADGVFTWG